MAISFGSLGCKVRNIVTYTLSPYELKAFGGVLTKGIPNTFNRIRGQFFRVATRWSSLITNAKYYKYNTLFI